ncbi:cell division protein FtsQ/DivIB [Agrilutibacter solisilvae]|uniref:Cell division protein FtsQ n=1 Tax=Agrilutibacter solisilvae TaxID=2763317 RepID=A0A974Y190_9GAMM|nr:cell division protein FtsQ/DivIB [Lysobacter solisilvae]QSX78555.1 cell division protein FtsQ/DivIB [Lysobacter solisilvae]
MNALLRIVGWVLALALVVLPVVAVLNGWVGAGHWPLTRLRATGEFRRVDGAQLRQTLSPFARRGFFAVDLDAAQTAVARLPWVESAEVRKRWPDVLEVRIVEHQPFAHWGDKRLLSAHGRLFPEQGTPAPRGLPSFRAPDARADEVVALYNESRELLAPVGLDVRAVELDPRGSWTLTLDNGARVILGRSQARARLSRFVRLLPQLMSEDAQRLDRADLRYTNGFALVWASLPQTRDGDDAPRDNGSAPLRPALPAPVDDAPAPPTARLRLPPSPFTAPAASLLETA